MPNSPSIDDTLLDIPNEQLNVEDYTWSVTSAGPDDYDPVSSVSWERVPSVHIANRLEGSVCLTPSDCTSFGPFDCTLTSPAPSIYRLPSPDIAYRMFEDAPQTPIGTTWGAPIEYPPSPAFFPQPPSVDLGERMVSSRPVTPVTATSWGPASWPSSPIHTEYTPNSVHLGDRGDFSRPVTPSTATSWGVRLSWLPSSATPFYGATFDAGHHGFEDTKHELGRSSASWSSTIGASGSRSRRAPVDTPWGHSWPYREFGSTRPSPQIFICVPSIYPHLVIYQSVYPHFDLYPRATLAEDSSPGYTDSSLYVDVSPPTTRDELAVQRAISVRLTPCYPVFDLYPAVYPDNLYKIYPPVFASTLSVVDLVSIYPFFNLYPSRSYPSQRTPATQNLDIETQKMQRYPNLGPYPASNGRIMSGNLKVPDHDFGYSLAQSVKVSRNSKAMEDIPFQSETSSFFTTDPTVYPHFNIYPSLILSTAAVVRPAECSVRLATYPFFDLYPAVYPAFEIYPQAEGANSPANKVVGSGVLGYPYIEIYTPIPTQEILSRKSLSVRAPPSYPTINLYPLVYPFIEPYPVLSYDVFRTPKLTGYPDFDLYPENAPGLKMLHNSSDHTGYVYPIFNLYPAVYPYFDLYPVVGGMVQIKKAARPHTGTVSVKIKPNYPAVSTYSTVYSCFELGPSIDLPRTGLVPRPKSLKLLDNPTNNELHATMAMERSRSTPVKSSRFNTRTNSHADPHCAVFPNGIVTTPSSVWDNDSPREVAFQSNKSSEALWGQVSTRTLWSNNAKLPSPVLNHDSRSTTFIASESTKDGILPLQTSRRAYLL
ncbi:hypothetical protein H2248_006383 [Termitomyces sp. 'cryptogamus']|nr:hypothetical protein H2248_006383 [Termitomyces sp. 'cryptogamus']